MSDRRDFYMTKGLPGSGKSTWAAEYVLNKAPGKAVRVNQDLLRIMLHLDRYGGGKTEPIIQAARNELIGLAMSRGVEVVISDDTNFHPDCEKDFRGLCEKYGYQLTIRDFTDVPIEECIKRDLKRTASVGEQVIRKMWNKYFPQNKSVPPVWNPELPSCVIVDIDGTVALMDGRGPYDFSKYHLDVPNPPVVRLVQDLAAAGETIVFCSGRDDTYFEETASWLNEWVFRLPPKHLFMRPADRVDEGGHKVKDSIVKQELYEKYIAPNWNVRFVLDDRNQVVEMWRNLGLTVLQVADGAF